MLLNVSDCRTLILRKSLNDCEAVVIAIAKLFLVSVLTEMIDNALRHLCARVVTFADLVSLRLAKMVGYA